MMGGMPPAKTSGNQPETLSDESGDDIITYSLESIGKRLDHLDDGIHALERQLTVITEFIDLHRPALARGLALMDPGAKVRSMLPSRKAKV
jgi:hypothetical protein